MESDFISLIREAIERAEKDDIQTYMLYAFKQAIKEGEAYGR